MNYILDIYGLNIETDMCYRRAPRALRFSAGNKSFAFYTSEMQKASRPHATQGTFCQLTAILMKVFNMKDVPFPKRIAHLPLFTFCTEKLKTKVGKSILTRMGLSVNYFHEYYLIITPLLLNNSFMPFYIKMQILQIGLTLHRRLKRQLFIIEVD